MDSSGPAGARRPENLVAARSSEYQNRCTGLVLPQNQPLNSSNTPSDQSRICQNRSMASRSHDACSTSSGNGVLIGRPNGRSLISTSSAELVQRAVELAVEVRHGEPVQDREPFRLPLVGRHDQRVVDEVEPDVERRVPVVEAPCGQPACIDVQRHVPPVVARRR